MSAKISYLNHKYHLCTCPFTYTYQLTAVFELLAFARVPITVEFCQKIFDFVYKNDTNRIQ